MHRLILIFLMLSTVAALAEPRDARERAEVVAIFELLTSKLVTEADISDVACIFSSVWDDSYRRNRKGEETTPYRPRELILLPRALDPMGAHHDMFCERGERDKQAASLAIATNKIVKVSSLGFSYPIFGQNYKTAIVYYQRQTQLFRPAGGRYPPVLVFGRISLQRRESAWSYRISILGQS